MSAETVKSSTTMSGKIVESIGDIVVASLEATAQISLGQGLLRIADRFLWVVEKSAQWSLPVQEVETEENGKTFGKIELVRPLPWIFFLPSLVMLRACRLGINVGAAILGYPKLQTTGMVKIIQKGRRRLRTIKSNGLRHMRYRKGSRNKDEELTEAKKSLIKSMLSTLSALSCLETSKRTPSPPPTRVCVQRSEPEAIPTPEEESTTESTSPLNKHKRKYKGTAYWDSAEYESTDLKLNRWAACWDGHDDDPDFVPREEDLITSDSCSSPDEDHEDYVSDSEIADLHIDNILHPYVPEPLVPVYEDVSSKDSDSDSDSEAESESYPEREPEVAAEPVAAMNKISTSNPAENTIKPLEPEIKKTDDNKLLQDEQPAAPVSPVVPIVTVVPVTPEAQGDNIVNFYSPINSPSDTIADFVSPVADDSNDATVANEQLNETTSKIVKEPENEPANEALKVNGTPAISGNSKDSGQTPATMNGTNHEMGNNHTTGTPVSCGIKIQRIATEQCTKK